MKTVISNARLVLASRITAENGWALVENGRFVAIGEDNAPDADQVIDAKGSYMFPGLVDLQINGGGGINFNDVQNDSDIQTILEANLSTGTTSLLATLITDKSERLIQSIQSFNAASCPLNSMVLGLHIEGPFFSPDKRGMHGLDMITAPNIDLTRQILDAGQGKIKIMTLAPELSGAIDVIQFLKKKNVIASMGHTMASYEETEAAIDAGATMATHLFNTMPSIHHRDPGMVPALLNSTCNIGIIADGEHVDPRLLKMVFKIGGPNYFLVSDAIAPLGSDITEFNYYGQKVWVQNGLCYITETTRAGSVTPLLDGAINAHKHIGLPLHQAINLASLTPAKIIGADKDVGSIDTGKQADFLIVSPNFKLEQVYRNGQKFDRVFNLN